MKDQGDIRISLLLFSVGGVHFGIESGQVAGMAAYDGEQAEDLFWFHEEMGYGDKTASYHSPTILTIRSEAGLPYRIIIDSMEDITEFSQNDIALFPALIEALVLRRGMWGVLSRNGCMVLLLDFQRLLKGKRSNFI